MLTGLMLGLLVGCRARCGGGPAGPLRSAGRGQGRRGPPGRRRRARAEALARRRLEAAPVASRRLSGTGSSVAEPGRRPPDASSSTTSGEPARSARPTSRPIREQLSGEFARLSTQALQQNNDAIPPAGRHPAQRDPPGGRRRAGQTAGGHRAAAQAHRRAARAGTRRGMQRLEVERQRAYTTLTEQMKHLSTSHDQLQKETRNLVTALRSPQTRGRWGELQLRRVVEMAGMLEHCDFDEQVTSDGDGGRLRPDMVVHLPGRQERGGRRQGSDAGVPRRQRGRGRGRCAGPIWPATAAR